MTEAQYDHNAPDEDLTLARTSTEQLPIDHRVASLRGPTAIDIGRKLWLFAGMIGLVIFAVALVVSLVSATNDNARINRMKSQGISVIVTVTYCSGNLSGSGSGSAGYTCRGDYTVDGVHYNERIGSMSTFVASGTTVRAVADPARHSTVVLASVVRASTSSADAFIPSGLLSIAFIALTVAFLRMARRSETHRRATSSTARDQR